MKKQFEVVLYKSSQQGYRHLYTIHFNGQKDNEFDQFLKNTNVNQHKDYSELLGRLNELLNTRGFIGKYFKFYQSETNLLIGYIRQAGGSDLRLYCSVFGENLLLIGGGGIKTTHSRQGTQEVQDAFARLEYVDQKIAERIENNEIYFDENNFIQGNLKFIVEE